MHVNIPCHVDVRSRRLGIPNSRPPVSQDVNWNLGHELSSHYNVDPFALAGGENLDIRGGEWVG